MASLSMLDGLIRPHYFNDWRSHLFLIPTPFLFALIESGDMQLAGPRQVLRVSWRDLYTS